MTQDEEYEKRMKEAANRKAAAEAKRREAAEAKGKAEALDRMEREAKEAEAIAELEAEHGADRIAVVRTRVGCVVVKRPHAVTYKKFRDVGSFKFAALEQLVATNLLYPALRSDLDKITQQQPAVIEKAAGAIIRLAGYHTEEVTEKS
ncbi:MAG: hypothetical protein AAGE52_42080 [Myxococcota bacterium]